MTGRMYTVIINAVNTPGAAYDLFEFVAASGKPLRLRRLRIGQSSDVDSEMLGLVVLRGATSSGSGGTTATPNPLNPTTPAAGFAAETMNTTQASGGAALTLVQDAFNVLNGIDWSFADDEAPEAVPGSATERLVVQMSVPTDPITVRATAWIEELG